MSEMIEIGSHVVVTKYNFKRVIQVSPESTFKINKQEIEMKGLAGEPFWTMFKIIQNKNQRKPCTLEVTTEKEEDFLKELTEDLQSGCDNRTIIDDGSSQKLSKEEILNLRESGKSSNEIINELIENSSSFATRTEFSQEKYIKKKTKKYCQYLSVHKPTIPDLQKIESQNNKANSLRMDTLAQILSYSDIQAEGSFLMYDTVTPGLVASSLLNRIGANTKGQLLNLHRGKKPIVPNVKYMDFPEELTKRFVSANIFKLLKLCKDTECSEKKNGVVKIENEVKSEDVTEKEQIENGERDLTENEKKENLAQVKDEVEIKVTEDCKSEESLTGNEKKRTLEQEIGDDSKPKKFKVAHDREMEALEMISNRKFDSLVVVAKEHPVNIVRALLKFLGSSRPFVIYHHHKEPLMEAYVELKQNYSIANLRLFSNFLRSYQVLQDRTHPDIDANDCGGYILTGYFLR